VYACVNRIANDIGNLPIKLTQKDANGIWKEIDSAAFSPVLKKPNRYQNHIQFKQNWMMSKLTRGNTYALKERDNRGVVVHLYVLNPEGAQVLVSPDGSIFYRFQTDNLTGIEESQVAIPASEIIHDRMNCLFHPLIGISPLYACGAAAAQGLKLQEDSAFFFANGANPGGVLTAPGAISDETAKRLQEHWDANYNGTRRGKVAVMGDGLRFEKMKMTYVDAQFIEQMRFNVDIVCSAFGVPPFKINMGTIPAGMKVGDMEMLYYNNALHTPIEEMEMCLDEGLGVDNISGQSRRTELDLEPLLRMDPATQADVQVKLVGGAIATPNEARYKFNLSPLTGGDTVYMQQQDFPLDQVRLNKIEVVPPAEQTPPVDDNAEDVENDQVRELLDRIQKGLVHE
jgi:HK97 family phage portal protein